MMFNHGKHENEQAALPNDECSMLSDELFFSFIHNSKFITHNSPSGAKGLGYGE